MFSEPGQKRLLNRATTSAIGKLGGYLRTRTNLLLSESPAKKTRNETANAMQGQNRYQIRRQFPKASQKIRWRIIAEELGCNRGPIPDRHWNWFVEPIPITDCFGSNYKNHSTFQTQPSPDSQQDTKNPSGRRSPDPGNTSRVFRTLELAKSTEQAQTTLLHDYARIAPGNARSRAPKLVRKRRSEPSLNATRFWLSGIEGQNRA